MAKSLPNSTILPMRVKAINKTLRPEKLVLSALVFDTYPFRNVLEKLRKPKATTRQRARRANEEHSEMDKRMATHGLTEHVIKRSHKIATYRTRLLIACLCSEKSRKNRIGGLFRLIGIARYRKRL